MSKCSTTIDEESARLQSQAQAEAEEIAGRLVADKRRRKALVKLLTPLRELLLMHQMEESNERAERERLLKMLLWAYDDCRALDLEMFKAILEHEVHSNGRETVELVEESNRRVSEILRRRERRTA